ncbi:unnamed protein product [Nezara viridula]|uniref:Uncharacterized protein n=1 Tax=Nezara viridula TaxID=85310 RepID=A0A9P0MRZ3_NEZVI|nr:unnamed protein product [Nezara viridula]
MKMSLRTISHQPEVSLTATSNIYLSRFVDTRKLQQCFSVQF